MSDYEFRGMTIPAYMLDGLKEHIQTGRNTGDFLYAVLTNDLRAAVQHADDHNIRNLAAYAAYLYNKAPSACWGSVEKVKEWADRGGLEGMEKQDNG